jgi:hypothetical protein
MRRFFRLEGADIIDRLEDALDPSSESFENSRAFDAEELAWTLLERTYGCPFERPPETGRQAGTKTADFRSAPGAWPPRTAEVKRLTRQEWLEVTNNFDRYDSRLESDVLTGRWLVPLWRPRFTTAPEPLPGSSGGADAIYPR